jgi:hypothetical protein
VIQEILVPLSDYDWFEYIKFGVPKKETLICIIQKSGSGNYGFYHSESELFDLKVFLLNTELPAFGTFFMDGKNVYTQKLPKGILVLEMKLMEF